MPPQWAPAQLVPGFGSQHPHAPHQLDLKTWVSPSSEQWTLTLLLGGVVCVPHLHTSPSSEGGLWDGEGPGPAWECRTERGHPGGGFPLSLHPP